MKRRRLIVLAVLLAACVTLMTSSCCPVAGIVEGEADSPSVRSEAEGGTPNLETFLDSDSKTGEYRMHTVWYEGDVLDQTGEFWVDGRLFRYDIYKDGNLVRSVLSPDGKTAYFAYHDTETCEPAVASVDYYLRRYFAPEGEGAEDGIDEETGAARIVYTVKKMDDMAGSSNQWYSEDITYLVKDDEVVGVITRGAAPEDDGSIAGLDVNRETWSNIQVGVSIPEKTFELPYPVKNAE